jgi:hypothetical protein
VFQAASFVFVPSLSWQLMRSLSCFSGSLSESEWGSLYRMISPPAPSDVEPWAVRAHPTSPDYVCPEPGLSNDRILHGKLTLKDPLQRLGAISPPVFLSLQCNILTPWWYSHLLSLFPPLVLSCSLLLCGVLCLRCACHVALPSHAYTYAGASIWLPGGALCVYRDLALPLRCLWPYVRVHTPRRYKSPAAVVLFPLIYIEGEESLA